MKPLPRPEKPEKQRYRKVTLRMWNDERFMELTPPKPSGQVLWFWLLTGPCSTPVPGVVDVTLGEISDRLQWPPAATKRCWGEIASRHMATADWSRSLVWLPNALKHNLPESPNVAKSWRRYLNEHVAECALRTSVEQVIKQRLQAMGPSFVEAFDEGGPVSFPESGNREQVQEPPHPPSGEGGRFTRLELTQAREDLIAYRDSQPRYVAPVHREAGREYPEPRRCPHEPECDDEAVCLALFAQARRVRVAARLVERTAS